MEDKDKVKEEENLKENSKITSIKEGNAFSVMDGFGLRYMTPFAVAIGSTNTMIGALSTLPNLIGNLSQLHTIKSIKKHKRKKIIVLGTFFQALMWLAIIAIGLTRLFNLFSPFYASLALLVSFSLLVSFGAYTFPAWNSWMKDLVSEKTGSYFAKRTAINGWVGLVCMLLAGIIIDYFSKYGQILIGFTIIFSIAMIGRLISSYFMNKKYEPDFKYDESTYFSFTDFIKKMFKNNFGKFVIFLGLFGFATNLSNPFFSVYLLKDLNFDNNYLAFTLITITSIISILLSSKYWGREIDRYGNIKVLKIASFVIVIIPLLRIISYPLFIKFSWWVIFYLLVIEVLSGIVWGGFTLAFTLYVYDAVTRQRISICISYSTIIASFGAFLGAFIGGILTKYSFYGIDSFLLIFGISSLVRLIVMLTVGINLKEIKNQTPFAEKLIKEIK